MALDTAIKVVLRWNSTSDNKSYVFTGKRDQIDQYLQAVDQIQCSIVSGSAYDHSGAKSAIQIAMTRLADEMCNLLKINCKSADYADSSTSMPDSGSNSYVDDYEYGSALSVAVIDDLRIIVQRMKGAGCLGDCKKAYIINRKRFIEDSYRKLEIQKLSSHDAQTLEWKVLDPIFKVWIRSSKICFRKIFAYEKQLCDNVFVDAGENIADDCFLKISSEYAFQLLEIATNLGCIKIASERLFGILELYKTSSDLLPEMNKLFNTPSSESLRRKAAEMVPEFKGAACKTIEKFEKDVLSADLSQPVPVDKIHSLCRYVMGYLIELGQHKKTLMELPLSKPPLTAMNLGIAEPPPQNEWSFHLMWIIMSLISRLENGDKQIKNATDVNFYLMNNFFYIVQKINGMPEVKEMIGDDCFSNVSSKYKQTKSEYLRLTLEKVLLALGDKKSPKRKLRSFNHQFKKLQIELGKLRVSDFQLLTEIRVSMEESLVPSYSSLLQQLSTQHYLTTVDDTLSVEQLKSAILGFFSST
ncbi:hypothetical protein R6Q59_033678 [Mikania micrantha]